MLQDHANVKKAYLMKSKLAAVHIEGLHIVVFYYYGASLQIH